MHWGQRDKIDDRVYYFTWQEIYFETTVIKTLIVENMRDNNVCRTK
jgi:hypothetical protein